MMVIPLEEESVGRLKGCALCVSRDGTIAVITVDGLELLVISFSFFSSPYLRNKFFWQSLRDTWFDKQAVPDLSWRR